MADGNTIKIVIVEDDELINDLLKAQAQALEYNVVGQAYNGPQAVELVQRLQPDVVWMDLQMPDPVSGQQDWQAGLQATRDIMAACPLPIIILTAYESPELTQQASQAGASAYLVKPAYAGDLERAVIIAQARFKDVLELRRLNVALEAALHEKDTLLAEIYHRAKNNLQLVSSLLNLQSGHVKDKADAELFRESSNRVMSMASINELLYRSKDLTHLDFGAYVRKLVSHLFRSYNTSGIEAIIQVREIYLDIQQTVPCGLVINELVSNALKHAFPAGYVLTMHSSDDEQNPSRQISVRMHQEENNYVLCVSDNGCGFPPEFDWQHTHSMGLQLVVTLAKQLDGQIELDNRSGVTFTLTFPSS